MPSLDLEERLSSIIILQEREEGHRVTGSQVKGWAKELAGEDLNFSASDGWCCRS